MNINFRILNFKDKNAKESTFFKIKGYLTKDDDFINRMNEKIDSPCSNNTIEGFMINILEMVF